LNESNDDNRSIVQRIVDGNVIINTVEEFEKVLNLYPDDPRMLRAYGDLLADKESKEAAIEPYRRASKLFIENGQSLQAIVTKILEWSIVKPTHSDGRIFHAAISACRSQESPLQNFFAQMAYPEMVAVMLRLVRVRLPAHYLVIEANDVSNEIYFIVSGSLSETTYLSADKSDTATNPSKAVLLENDIFGNVIPFDKDSVSHSDVETLTRAELVKLSKPVLMSVCKKFPKVELLVSSLHRAPGQATTERSWQRVRRAERHEIPIQINLKILRSEENKPPLILEGFTKDISLGGACIDLGAKYWAVPASELEERIVELEINLPNADTTMSLKGEVAWTREIPQAGKTILELGIEFIDLTKANLDLLNQFCIGAEGEQNLIWSLWESFVKK
jgi:CRP-like cAMP-binding protein